MSHSSNNATFWVVAVGEPQTMEHTRKSDGEKFTVTKTPLTLQASMASGLETDIKFTMWVSDKSVVDRAKQGVTRSDALRLALANDPEDFESNGPKVNRWNDKTTGESRERLVQTIWLSDSAEPKWTIASVPTARDAGNIASVVFPTESKTTIDEVAPFGD